MCARPCSQRLPITVAAITVITVAADKLTDKRKGVKEKGRRTLARRYTYRPERGCRHLLGPEHSVLC